MSKGYIRIANVFSEGELALLEDALQKYQELSIAKNMGDHYTGLIQTLKFEIIDARRWSHQLGKVERN